MNSKIWGALVALVLVLGLSSAVFGATVGTVTMVDTVYTTVDASVDSSKTAITGPKIAEAGVGAFIADITINAPAGFEFSQADSVSVASPGAGNIAFTATKVKPGATTIVFGITTPSTVVDTVTFSGIKVFPTTTTAAKTGSNLTLTATTNATADTVSGSCGLIILYPGASTKLVYNTQPVGGVDAGTALGTQPIVHIQDQFNNVARDASSVVTLAPYLHNTTTPGNGVLQGTIAKAPTAADYGVIAFTGISYTKKENINLNATATGLTSIKSTVSIVIGAGAPAQVTLSSDKSTMTVLQTATLTATLTDVYFNPVDGTEQVTFTEVTGVGGAFTTGTVATSASNGTATDTYTPSQFYVGSVTLKAHATATPTVSKTVVVTVTPGPLGNVDLTPATQSMVVGTAATFTAKMVDAFGNQINALSVDEVTFTAIGGTAGTTGTVGAKSLAAGKVSVLYTARTLSAASDTLKAETVSGGYIDKSEITTTSGPPATMKFMAADSTVVASDSTNTEALTDSVWDQYGNKSSGYWVKFAVISVGGVGKVSADSVQTTSGGVATLNYLSGRKAQVETVRASYGSVIATLNITVKPDVTAKLDVPSLLSTQAGQPVTIAATQYDRFDNHVTETDSSKVAFTKITGQGTLAGAATRVVNVSGNVQIVYTAYAVTADTAKIQALFTGVTPDTVMVINTPPGALANFTIAFDQISASVEADSIKVTITAVDNSAIRIWTYRGAGETITLNGSAATAAQFSWHAKPGWSGKLIVDAGLNASLPDSAFVTGQIEFSMLNQKAESGLTFTINDPALSVSATSGAFTFTPGVVSNLVVAAPASATAGAAFDFTVTPKDQFANVNPTQVVLIQVSANYADEVSLNEAARRLVGPATYSATANVVRTDLKLRAWQDATGAYYGESAAIAVAARVIDAPGIPTIADVPADNGGWVQMTFDASTSGLNGGGYQILREVPVANDTTGLKVYELWATTPDVVESSVTLTLSTMPYLADVTNWGVRAVDGAVFSDMNVSAQISEADGQVSAIVIGTGGAVDNIAPAAATIFRAVDNPGDVGGAVLMSWTLSADEGLVSSPADLSGRQNVIYGVTGYEIYRDGALIATVSRGISIYVDESVANNVAYSYVVKAVDGTFAAASLANGARAVNNTLMADFSSNLRVWTEDFALFVGNFGLGEADAEFDGVFDLSGNGKVWTEDFTIFVGQFGATGGAGKSIASIPVGVNSGANAALEVSRDGASVIVDVSAQGLTEVSSYGLMVSFDPEALQFLAANGGNLLGSNSLFTAIPTKAGEVWVLNGQPETVSIKNGLLSQLHFRTLSDQAIGSAIRVEAIDLFDRDAGLNSLASQDLTVTVAPEKFALLQNYPNPGNPSTVISYALAKSSKVNLTVYNSLGQAVRTLVDGHQAGNVYNVVWNARDDSGKEVASGVYFYRLAADKFSATKRLIVLK